MKQLRKVHGRIPLCDANLLTISTTSRARGKSGGGYIYDSGKIAATKKNGTYSIDVVEKKEKMHLWVKYHCVKWINVVWQPFFMVKVNILWRRSTCILMFWKNCWFKWCIIVVRGFKFYEITNASIEVWWSGWVYLLYFEWSHYWTVRVWWCECVRFFCCCKIKIC